jgi:hypothetical protein
MSTYDEAYEMAIQMMHDCGDDLEICSALKEAGAQHGIAYGDDMQKFVEWAQKRMGL